jgi:hypothetical protein
MYNIFFIKIKDGGKMLCLENFRRSMMTWRNLISQSWKVTLLSWFWNGSIKCQNIYFSREICLRNFKEVLNKELQFDKYTN